MTEEQIKQNADAYANSIDRGRGFHRYLLIREAYIEGAHSRDDEIKDLEARIYMLEKAIKVNEYFEEAKLDQLRNPWISVEERLPEEGKCVFVRYGDVTHPLYSSAYMIEKDLWSIEGYGNGEVSHWMPIPQIEKGE